MKIFWSLVIAFGFLFAFNLTPKLQKEINQGKRIAKVFILVPIVPDGNAY